MEENPQELVEVKQRDRGEKIGLIEEVWVPCFCSKSYEVSNLGMVRNKKNKRLLMPQRYYQTENDKKNNSYTFGVNIEKKFKFIHQMVFFSFYPNKYKWNYHFEFHIDHINGIKIDNRLVNLRSLDPLINSKKGNKDESNGLF